MLKTYFKKQFAAKDKEKYPQFHVTVVDKIKTYLTIGFFE